VCVRNTMFAIVPEGANQSRILDLIKHCSTLKSDLNHFQLNSIFEPYRYDYQSKILFPNLHSLGLNNSLLKTFFKKRNILTKTIIPWEISGIHRGWKHMQNAV
jgi:hypothetical protein